MCTTNDDHIMYGSCDIKQDMSYWKTSWRYYHFKHEYHKWKSYDVWFLRYGARQAELFLILDHFFPFYTTLHPNNPDNQNFEKMKKAPGDFIIFHKCTINDNDMIYGSWDMKCTRQNFFVILGHFLYKKIIIIGYTVPEIWHVTDVIVIFHFGL